MIKRFILIQIIIGYSILASAQIKITGLALDKDTHKPIEGAVVVAQNESIKTVTDSSGEFTIIFNGGETTLTISHLGYNAQTINLKPPFESLYRFKMESRVTDLEEVIVTTGYQQIPKERATGSFSYISNEQLNWQVTTNILERLPAIANGLTVNMGTFSEQQHIMIRGLSTIQGPKSPLIIVDNFPYEGDISNINPNMVEDITILKDAAAASIWGARAANGVIVIKTKTASLNQPIKVEFNANLNLSDKPNLNYLKPISSADFIDVEMGLFERGFYNSDINSPNRPVLSPIVDLLNKESKGMITREFLDQEINRLRSLDIRDQYDRYMYQTLKNQQYFLNVSIGTDKASWSSGVGYDHNEGNLGEIFKRLNLRIQNIWKPIKPLILNTGVSFTNTLSQSGRPGYGGVVMKNTSIPPYVQFADEHHNPLTVFKSYDQSFKDSLDVDGLLDWNYYPLNDWEHSYSRANNSEIIINSGLNYKIVNGLETDFKYQYQRQTGNNDRMDDEQSYTARDFINRFAQLKPDNTVFFVVPRGAILDKANRLTTVSNYRGQINYNRGLGNHSINALAGGEIRKSNAKYDSNRYYGYNQNNLTLGSIDYTSPYPNFVNGSRGYIQNGQSLTELNTNFVSLYANAAYTYSNRYTFSLSGRRDASNLFGLNTNDQWNPFWSTGLAWNISQESFYQSSILPYLKFRATYGFNGNIDPAMVALTTIAYTGSNSLFTRTPMARFDNHYNPDLKWETSKMFNFALDFAFVDNRVSGALEYFMKNGEDLFGISQIDYTTGIPTGTLFNTANMKGKGVDIELKAIIFDKIFKWNSSLNLNYFKDKVSKYYLRNQSGTAFINPGYVPIAGIEGKPVYSIFGLPWAGLDPVTGDPQGFLDGEKSKDYTRLTGSGIQIEDLDFFGSALPITYGSFNNSFSYKRFNVHLSLVYKMGYWFRRSSINYTSLFNGWIGHSDYADRWQNPGDEKKTDVPSNIWISSSNRDGFYERSSALVGKGDHVRMQNISLSYEVDKKLWVKSPFQSLKLYCNASNLGILWKANKHGIDPDYNIGNSVLAPPTVYTIGINANF